MEEPDRVGVPAVLAADPDLELRACGAAALDAHADERPDAVLVDRPERGALHDAAVHVAGHDPALDVVAREAEPGLREVVGAEREELGVACDVAGHEARAGQLDHGADDEAATGREALLRGDAQHQLARLLELARVGDERDHDLEVRRLGRCARARPRRP